MLNQSDYFKTLFNGSFRESKLDEIELFTKDDLITEGSFEKILDLMYNQTMSSDPEDIFNITVTAQYFQMNEIVDFCEEQMGKMIKGSNAIDIYLFADRYFLRKAKENAFQWMLMRLFPVKSWDQLSYLTVDLAEQLISDPRLVVPNEVYCYLTLKILIQIYCNGTSVQNNEPFYREIRENETPFLNTTNGKKFCKAFQKLRLGNILVRKENVEMLLYDNIIPRSAIDSWIFCNWMSLIAIESPDNFGPSNELVTVAEFKNQAMRFSKIIYAPDYNTWKFTGFSYAFDLALFFDGRTLIIKRVHQINEHKVSHSHLIRRIMLRFDIFEMNSSMIDRQQEIQTITLSTNEEICLKQLKKEIQYPCRIGVEVLFHVPYKVKQSLVT